MSARRLQTLADYDRHIAAGFGEGEGSAYKPWYAVKDVPSTGRSHIFWSALCQREHQLLSDLQYHYFLIRLYVDKRLTDARETKPIPIASSLAIAQALGFAHPRIPRSAVPRILTTSFLFSLQEQTGKLLLQPVSVLAASSLKPQAALATLQEEEIKRVFWASEGLRLTLATDQEIDRTLAANLATISQALQEPDVMKDATGLNSLAAIVPSIDWTAAAVNTHLRQAAKRLQIPLNRLMSLFKLLVWQREIDFDLTQGCFHPAEPLWQAPTFGAFVKAAAERNGRKAA